MQISPRCKSVSQRATLAASQSHRESSSAVERSFGGPSFAGVLRGCFVNARPSYLSSRTFFAADRDLTRRGQREAEGGETRNTQIPRGRVRDLSRRYQRRSSGRESAGIANTRAHLDLCTGSATRSAENVLPSSTSYGTNFGTCTVCPVRAEHVPLVITVGIRRLCPRRNAPARQIYLLG